MEQYGAIWHIPWSTKWRPASAPTPQTSRTRFSGTWRWLCDGSNRSLPPKLHRNSTHSKQNETKKCRPSAFPTNVVDLKDLPCPSCNLCKLDVLSRSIHNRGEVHKRIVVPAMTADSWTDLMKRFHEEIWTVISVISCRIAVDVIESPCRNFGARHLCVASLRSKGEHLSGEQLSTRKTKKNRQRRHWNKSRSAWQWIHSFSAQVRQSQQWKFKCSLSSVCSVMLSRSFSIYLMFAIVQCWFAASFWSATSPRNVRPETWTETWQNTASPACRETCRDTCRDTCCNGNSTVQSCPTWNGSTSINFAPGGAGGSAIELARVR
jgi:hypothetical protein